MANGVGPEIGCIVLVAKTAADLVSEGSNRSWRSIFELWILTRLSGLGLRPVVVTRKSTDEVRIGWRCRDNR